MQGLERIAVVARRQVGHRWDMSRVVSRLLLTVLLGTAPLCAQQSDWLLDPSPYRAELHEHLFHWLRTRKHRTARTDAQIIAGGGEAGPRSRGVYRGYWGPED